MKTIGAAAGGLLLVSSAALTAAPALLDMTAEATPVAAEQATESAVAGVQEARPVEGTFSYDQGVVTSNAEISSVFARAAATLCQAVEIESMVSVAGPLTIAVNGAPVAEATVADLSDDEGTDSYVIGCACASNVAGGGAVANAEVSGVTLASLAAMAA